MTPEKEDLWTRVKRGVPFGVLHPHKPRHYRDMLKVAWENKDELPYALRILQHGVCDGCSLGPRGLKDDVIPGTHLCLTRLKLLRVNTMGAMPDGAWEDMATLRGMTNEELQNLGRIPYPLLYRKGDKGFRRISWDEALDLAASGMTATSPERMGFFVTSRGLTNEPYYVTQKLARVAGTNNVDLCSRLCHAPTVTGLRETLGYSAPTCGLGDLIGTDLLILFGTDLANNQPVTTKYMHEAKKRGTKILVVNPLREPGLERYWIPSVPSSALFGTKLMDEFYQVNAGGDIAFISGVLKALLARGGEDRAFIDAHTTGWDALREHLDALQWEDLEANSGLPRAQMEHFAELYANAKTAVLVYSMGLTQHVFGVDNVRAIVNLALSRGMIGRDKCGIMPIRGHSGVQGGGECGVDPHRFPGGLDVNPENAKRLEEVWTHPVPAEPGLMTGDMLEAAHRGEMDLLYTVGGNLVDTMPDPAFVREALARVRLRIHQDIVLNKGTLAEPGEMVLVLPAQTRYEQRSGGTSTSTERRIRFTPEIPGRRIGEAKPEWEIPALIGLRLRPKQPALFDYADTQAIREEMAKVMPIYAGVETLREEGQWVQWGGPHLGRGGHFEKMPGGRARFTTPPVPQVAIPEGKFHLTTRRGKQFNSMVFGRKDAQMGMARRDIVFMREEDAHHLRLVEGSRVRLTSETGTFEGIVAYANVAPRHLQVYWPEGNVLLPRVYDPEAGVPDYNAFVELRAVPPERSP